MLSNLLEKTPPFMDFKKDVLGGRLSHAYIIFSEDIEVRKVVTNLISGLIFCKARGCGECPHCQKIINHSHEDIKIYNEDGKLKVKDAEKIIEDAYIKGWTGEQKLYFIENAESLSPQVQNKLLKMYEEPPRGVIIFLMAGRESGILPTINSRAKKVYLPLFTSKEVFEQLLAQGMDRSIAETASAFSGGRFDKAYSYAEQGGYVDIYDRVFEVLTSCKKSSDIVEYINLDIFSKDNITVTIEFMEIILRDCLEKISGGSNYITINKDYYLRNIAEGFSAGGVAMALLALVKARKMLSSNINATTVAETILFDILEAKYKWQ